MNLQELAKKYADEKKYGTIVKTLGSGYKGSSFLTNQNIVIKITSDKEEYSTALDIAKSSANGEYTPHYFSFKYENPYYILAMEKITPIKLNYKQQEFLNRFRDILLDGIEEGKNKKVFKNFITNKITPGEFSHILLGLIDCVYGLHKVGISNADIHEDNIGINEEGRIVMFDVVSANLVESKSLIERLEKLTKKKVILK